MRPPTPTADDVAAAIVAACRETRDDPLSIASAGLGPIRARHYALHALLHVFPKADKIDLCRCVGSSKPKQFWMNSWNQVVRPRNGATRMAGWWDEAAYDRVIRAVEAARTARAMAPRMASYDHLGDANEKVERTVEVSSCAKPPPYRPAPLPRRPDPAEEARRVNAARGAGTRFAGLGWPEPAPAPSPGKQSLQQMLADAAANTARQQARTKE